MSITKTIFSKNNEYSVEIKNEELKNLIESARVAKGISQRELAKLTGISRSTLNDLINGKISLYVIAF